MSSKIRKAALFAGVSAVTAGFASVGNAQSVAQVDVISSPGNVLASAQNNSASTSASATGNNVQPVFGNDPNTYAVQNSTVTITGNNGQAPTVSASTSGNSAGQTLGVSTVNQLSGSGVARTSVSSSAGATTVGNGTDADLGVYSAQSVVAGATTSATASGSKSISSNRGASASTLTVANGVDAASAASNSSTSAFTASGANAMTASVGVGTAQRTEANVAATASTSNSVLITGAPTGVPALSVSTVSVTGNVEQAVASGNTTTNSADLSGLNSFTSAAGTGEPNFATAAASNGGSIGVAAIQAAASQSTSAIVDNIAVSSRIAVVIDTAVSNVNNDDNTLAATAQSNLGDNSVAFDAVNVAGAVNNVAAVTSVQNAATTTTVAQVRTDTSADYAVFNDMSGVVISSSVSASDNDVSALAAVNRVANEVSATAANAISTPSTNTAQVSAGAGVSATGAFTVGSSQQASGVNAVASLTNASTVAGVPTNGTAVRTAVGVDVLGSSVVSDGNTQSASAAGNVTVGAGNALSLAGSTISANAAVGSVQSVQGALTALVGSAGTPAVAGFSVDATGTSAPSGATFTFTGTAPATLTQYNALVAAYAGNPNYSFGPLVGGNFIVTISNLVAPINGTTPLMSAAQAAVPGAGGVSIAVGNDIVGSTVRMADNASSGDVIGNAARNSLAVNGTTSVSVANTGSAASVNLSSDASSSASVANRQAVAAVSTLRSAVAGQYLTSAGDDVGNGTVAGGATVLVDGNTLASSVTGNSASNASALSGGTLAATSALSNDQLANVGTYTAGIGSDASATVQVGDDVLLSSVTVSGNGTSAAILANDAVNSVSATASQGINRGDQADNASSTSGLTVLADYALGNAQLQNATEAATAYGQFSVQGLSGVNAASDQSALAVSGNSVAASADGNAARSTIALDAGSVSSNGGINNYQISGGELDAVSGAVGAPASAQIAYGYANGGSLSVTGNGFTASSQANLASSAVNVASDTGIAGDNDPTSSANAGQAASDYAAYSTQGVNNGGTFNSASVLASASIGLSGVNGAVNLGGPTGQGSTTTNATVDVSGNVARAAVGGNAAATSVSLDAATVAATSAATSLQSAGQALSASVQSGSGAAVTLASAADDSTVSVDGNRFSAIVSGNEGETTLAVDGGTAITSVLSQNGQATVVGASADYALYNQQSANVGADADQASASGTFTANVGGRAVTAESLIGSTVSASDNELLAAGQSNVATNEVALSGGSIDATAALANAQTGERSVFATVAGGSRAGVTLAGRVDVSSVAVEGNEFAAVTAGNAATNMVSAAAANAIAQPSTLSATADASNTASATFAARNVQTLGNSTIPTLSANANGQFTIDSTVPVAAAALVTNSSVSASDNVLRSAVQGNFADTTVAVAGSGVQATGALMNLQTGLGFFSASTIGSAGVAVTGSTVDLIQGSTVAADGNAFAAASTVNTASNTVSVSGAQAATSAALANGGATANAASIIGNADYALSNNQQGGSALVNDARSFGSVAVSNPISVVVGSNVSASGNDVSADAQTNVADNTLSIEGGSVALSAALTSLQDGGPATSSANMVIAAPASVVTSIVSLDANTASASSIANDVSNTLTAASDAVLATRTSPVANATASTTAVLPTNTTADFALANRQTSGIGSVAASSVQTISNNDDGLNVTSGTQSSTVSIDGNVNQSEALANRANNALALSGNTVGATGAVTNRQSNGVSVNGSANTTVDLALNTSVAPVGVNQSSATISGNSTLARAGGSNASNSLSVSATNLAAGAAGMGTPATSLNAGMATGSASAPYAVLNNQGNTGAINATANVTYGAGFSGTAPTQVGNSAVALNGNTVTAVGYGNAATNTLNLTALNGTGSSTGPVTSSVASVQNNSGAVTATAGFNSANTHGVTNVVSNSSMGLNGNAASASAFGNSSVNAATLGGTNLTVGN